MTASLRESLKSLRLSTRKTSVCSQPPYNLQSSLAVSNDDFDPVSRFSSCSTSASSSCESLASSALLSCSSATTNSIRSRTASTGSSNSTRSTVLKHADHYYPLIATIQSSQSCEDTLISMAHAHNALIRAVNSCYNHAQAVNYDQLADYLLFCQTLFNTISQLLKAEQDTIEPSLLEPHSEIPLCYRKQVPISRDPAFFGRFHAWANYVHDPVTRESFSPEYMCSLVRSFAPRLAQHLHETISTLAKLSLQGTLQSAPLTRTWAKINQIMINNLDPETDIVLLLGCQDKDFKVNQKLAAEEFPTVCVTTATKIKKWYSRQHKMAWTFCPSDFHGKRRMLSA